MINGMILTNCLGALIAYFNIFGNIMTSIYKDLGYSGDSIFGNATFYVLLLAFLNMPPIFKRTVKELKIISYLLFISVMLFVVAILIELGVEGTKHNPDENFGQYYEVHFKRETITAISIFLWAYSF